MIGPPLRLALWALLLAAAPAGACMTSSSHLALIHAALPSPLPEGAIVAEVEIETGGTPDAHGGRRAALSAGLRARVRRIGHRADYAGGHADPAARAIRRAATARLDNGTDRLCRLAFPAAMRMAC